MGQQLRGNSIADPRARAQKRRFSHLVSDDATVQAVFAGRSYIVVTDSRVNPNIRSAWENPFMAGVPRSVTLFDNSAEQQVL